MANGRGKSGNSDTFLYSWAPQSLQTVTTAMELKDTPCKEVCDKPRQCIKKQRHHFANKGPYSQSYSFSSSHVQMWELGHKEGWVLKNWCFWIVVLKKTLESPLDCKEIKPVNPKGNQPWIFIGKTGDEAPIFLPLDVKSWLIRKDPDAGKDWKQKEKGAAEDELVREHHWHNRHEFQQTLEDTGGQRSMVSYSPWNCKEVDTI